MKDTFVEYGMRYVSQMSLLIAMACCARGMEGGAKSSAAQTITTPEFAEMWRIPDQDADGVSEILLAMPFVHESGRAGVVRILSGRTLDTIAVIVAPDGANAFGFGFAMVGDLDADGSPDFAIGAPGYPEITSLPIVNNTVHQEPGSVYLLSSKTGTILGRITGGAPGDAYGTCVAYARDSKGGQSGKLAIGAPGQNQGVVYVYSLPTIDKQYTCDPNTCAVIDKREQQVRFGYSVAFVDDCDADEESELVIGAPCAGHVDLAKCPPEERSKYDSMSYAGMLVEFSGKSGKMLWSHRGSHSCDRLGACIAVRSSAKKGGDRLVIAGALDHYIAGIAIKDGCEQWRIETPRPAFMDGYASSVSVLESNPSVPMRIIVGSFNEWGTRTGSPGPGTAYLYDTNAKGVLSTHSSIQFGVSGCALGDVDRDGIEDYAMVNLERPLVVSLYSGKTNRVIKSVTVIGG